MNKIFKVDNIELEHRISDLIEKVESQPEQWYKLLIARLVKQELIAEELMRQVCDLRDLEKLNSLIIDNKLLDPPAFLRNTYEVRATSNLWPDQGFYAQDTFESGMIFRWTKQNFYFELPVKREKEKQIHLHLPAAIKDEVLENIECYANGTAIPLGKLSEGTGVVLEGVLPETFSSNVTRLSFHTKTSFSPQEINPGSKDSRLLAVAFVKLTVE